MFRNPLLFKKNMQLYSKYVFQVRNALNIQYLQKTITLETIHEARMLKRILANTINQNEINEKCLTLKDVICTVNKNLSEAQHFKVQRLNELYGNTDEITAEIQKLFKKQAIAVPNIERIFTHSKIWSCVLEFDSTIDITFKGIGITKQTAEHNSKLAALLWLKEINLPVLKSLEKPTHWTYKSIIKQLNSAKDKNFLNNCSDVPLPLPNLPTLRRPELSVQEGVRLINKTITENDLNLRKNTTKIYLNCDNEQSKNINISNKDSSLKAVKSKKNSIGSHVLSLELTERLRTFSFLKRQILRRPRFGVQERLFVTGKPLKENEATSETKVESQEQCLKEEPKPSHTLETYVANLGMKEKIVSKPIAYVQKDSLSKLDENSVLPKNGVGECKQIHFNTLSEIQHIHDTFPAAKSIVHNYYAVLSGQLQNKTLKVEPMYKSSKTKKGSEWTCMYHIKWPENCKIYAKAPTKKAASAFAATRTLAYLSECQKISPQGLPLMFSKADIKQLTQKKLTEINLDDKTALKMQSIIDIFNEKMNPIVNNINYDYEHRISKDIGEEPGSVNFFLANKPKYLGLDKYFSKEKIKLPISDYKDHFIELLQNNNCVIVKGEPGCGKSSRVPQYVLESWVTEATTRDDLCRIAVTQPRRIAAISLAERVASEREEQLGHIIGYQVRLKSDFQPKTGRILYCTTGILLRHLQGDPNLTKFSHVIIDEAHERDVNTDLLLNLLKKAIKENDKLKVVIMSATIDTNIFAEYFEGAPIFNVPGFTYPVKKFFLDNSELDVTKTLKMCNSDTPQVIHADVVQVLKHIHRNKKEGAILVFLPGWEDLKKVERLLPLRNDIVVHLVHSRLKDSEQRKIFLRPPPGVRKIILATNIAETSITIDDVVYVVDSGIHKDNIFDNDKGINVIDMEWISKANANQRAGRAGRCAPGESYHLYSEDKFQSFPDYSSPKILNSSLTKIVLDSKVFTNNMNASDFMNSLITPPEKLAVERAVDELRQLDLLDESENLTPLGRTLVNFQLEPKLAKAMVNGVVFKCTTPVVDIVTLFSSDTELFGSLSLMDKDCIKRVKTQFCKSSDHLAIMRIYEKWLQLTEEEDSYSVQRFCDERNLVSHKLEFLRKLKNIHYDYLYNGLYESMPVSDDFSDSDELVKAVLYSGTGTVLEHRNWDMVKNRLKANANVLVTRNNHKANITSDSVNYKRHKFPSNFLVYINETRSNIRRTTVVRECSLIPTISVLLFSNKKLELILPQENDVDNNITKENEVIIGIKNTNLSFICDKGQADLLISCKNAIDLSYKFLVHQLTYAGDDIPDFLNNWDKILQNLNEILENYKIE